MSQLSRCLLGVVAVTLRAVLPAFGRGPGSRQARAGMRPVRMLALGLPGGAAAMVFALGGLATPALADSCSNAQYRTGYSAGLPDCRAFEQVSPPNTDDYDTVSTAGAAGGDVSVDGNSIAFVSTGAFAGAQSSVGVGNWYVATRGASGWSTQSILPPFTNLAFAVPLEIPVAYSPDLSKVVEQVGINVPGEASPSEYYLWSDGSLTQLYSSSGASQTAVTYGGQSSDFSQILLTGTLQWDNGTVSTQTSVPVASECTTGDTGQSGPGGNCSSATLNLPLSDFVNREGYLTSIGYFTSADELTNSSNTGTANQGLDLYEYNETTGQLTDISADSSAADTSGAVVKNGVAASSDGSYVYFLAEHALGTAASEQTCGIAATAHCNLYAWHDGTVSFIAALTRTQDSNFTGLPSQDPAEPGGEGGLDYAQVSPDGSELAFVTTAQLTSYDNEGNAEVYVYNVNSGNTSCISCNPSGAAPAGAAGLGGNGDLDPEVNNIADGGNQIFFQSDDALSPQATAGVTNVYEWEADGAGSCTSDADNGGCIYLLSDGSSAYNSYFIDASPSGNDVAISSRSQLAGSDPDQNYAVYDVRVDGGFPAAPPAAAGCDASATCEGAAAGAPSAPSIGTVAFAGPGNATPAQSTSKATAGKVKVTKEAVKGSAFTVSVTVPAKGKLTVTGADVKKLSKSASKAGTYKLTLKLTAKAKKQLQKKRKLKVAVKVAYRPASGKSSTATVAVELKA